MRAQALSIEMELPLPVITQTNANQASLLFAPVVFRGKSIQILQLERLKIPGSEDIPTNNQVNSKHKVLPTDPSSLPSSSEAKWCI